MDDLQISTIDTDVFIDKIDRRLYVYDFSNTVKLFENYTGKIIAKNATVTLKNGVLHSFNDEPAYITENLCCWTTDGTLHRNGGPSFIENGKNIFYTWGYRCSFKYYITSMSFTDEEKLELVLKYG